MSQDDLLAVRNFGEKSLNELKDTLIARSFLPDLGASHPGAETDRNGFYSDPAGEDE
jgi:DNA-directed RNA polymerase subunit alpha